MPDVDLPKAEHALSVLRQARLSRNETAATLIAELVYEMAYTGSWAPEIEEARKIRPPGQKFPRCRQPSGRSCMPRPTCGMPLSKLPSVGRTCWPRVI